MDAILPQGTRLTWTALDEAAMLDIGWGPASPPPAPAPSPPVVTPVPVAEQQTVVFTGGSDGTLTMFQLVNGVLTPTGQQFTPYVGYHGVLRVAAGDFYGNGVTDYAVTTGTVGPQSVVEILSGVDGSILVNQTAVFSGFDGRLFSPPATSTAPARTNSRCPPAPAPDPRSKHSRWWATAWCSRPASSRSTRRTPAAPASRSGTSPTTGSELVVASGGQAQATVAIYSGAELRFGIATPLTADFIPFLGYG